MNLKSYFLSVVFVLALFSCSEDHESPIETNTSVKKDLLRFTSDTEIKAKVAEIVSFKKAQEQAIFEKLSQQNNIGAPSPEQAKMNAKSTISDTERAMLLQNVKAYHSEKLNAIYAERTYFGFTSIQSIADEINFLKLVDSKKSNLLYERYKNLLTVNQYETSTIFNSEIANLINVKGELFLNNINIATNHLKKVKTNNSFGRSIGSGVVATGYNNFINITYSADIDYSTAQIITTWVTTYVNGEYVQVPVYETVYTYQPSTTLTCFVLSTSGYVAYNCYFFTNTNSYASFTINNRNHILPFGSGVNTNIRVQGDTFTFKTATPESVTGTVSGNFAIPLAGTGSFLWVSGSKNF